ncbi:acyl-CoA dehydrogenase [Clavibacter michiganensis]|uniref:acyl-CoA oxidase n=1 Tax=Clavibacter michiganensis TaxID=28447 RepID=A0A2S5VJB5_9MICO|nr:acyl-CoA dehydrogenase [Clavibacter michiganensis]PPF62770.1 acyl-CoA dehydrogenase [Clavibacter michiganensis]
MVDTAARGRTTRGTRGRGPAASPRDGGAPADGALREADVPVAGDVDAEVARDLDRTDGTAGTGNGPQVDVARLGRILLGRWADVRTSSRELTSRPELHRVEGLDMHQHRARVTEQLKILVEHGGVHRAFPRIVGGLEDHGGNIAGFEELVAADPSLQIKAGVQWGLFGSAVMHLGTERHHRELLPGIMSLETPGAFAMTETGHGSDVASIGTTATYDPETGAFDLHTPFRAAWKDYLGNAAVDGRAATVFAQLVTQGVNHGVHCFFVPLRDEHGAFLPGVGGEDDGLKGGLNGIDNGRLHFDHVRVPRANLLNRYGDVAEDGTYTSEIPSPGRRFFTMLGTLVQGRVSLDGAATSAAKIALQIAVTYGNERRQFVAGGTDEEVLLDYQRHQRRLIPRIATTYAASFAHEKLLGQFDSVFSGATDTDEDRQDLETLAAALKPLSTWHALDTIQEAREACGGQGFLAENRLVGLRADLDVYATFEGDNTVLLQLVAKRLLTDVNRRFAKADFGVLARYVVEQAADRTLRSTGLRTLGQALADRGSTARSVGQLREPDTQRALLTGRVETMVGEIATALRATRKMAPAEAATLFNRHQDALIEAARAHAQLLQWEAFTEALDPASETGRAMDDGTRRILTWTRDLFGLRLIEEDLAWYLIHGRISAPRARAVTAYIDRLVARLRPHAQDLVDAFGYTPAHVRAAVASGEERARQDEARAYRDARIADGTAPRMERSEKKRTAR